MAVEWMHLDALVGEDIAIDYLQQTQNRTKPFQPATIHSCEGELILAVNALVDYAGMLDQYLEAHKDALDAFTAAYYAEHGDRCRRVANKLATALGYDREATLARCQKRRAKAAKQDDIGEEALVMTVLGRQNKGPGKDGKKSK